MKSFTYTVTVEEGIHARPAAKLAKEARNYSSNLTIAANGGSADLKKLVSVLKLCISKGTTVTVSVCGENEEEDSKVLQRYFENCL